MSGSALGRLDARRRRQGGAWTVVPALVEDDHVLDGGGRGQPDQLLLGGDRHTGRHHAGVVGERGLLEEQGQQQWTAMIGTRYQNTGAAAGRRPPRSPTSAGRPPHGRRPGASGHARRALPLRLPAGHAHRPGGPLRRDRAVPRDPPRPGGRRVPHGTAGRRRSRSTRSTTTRAGRPPARAADLAAQPARAASRRTCLTGLRSCRWDPRPPARGRRRRRRRREGRTRAGAARPAAGGRAGQRRAIRQPLRC